MPSGETILFIYLLSSVPIDQDKLEVPAWAMATLAHLVSIEIGQGKLDQVLFADDDWRLVRLQHQRVLIQHAAALNASVDDVTKKLKQARGPSARELSILG